MKKNNYGGTLIGIIIGMLILTFIALSIINIVSFNKDIVNEYQIQTDKNILKQNTNNILKKINLSKIQEGETFYINKNETTKTFEVFTGANNIQYKYINNLGDKVNDLTSFDKKIYARDLRLSTDIIKKLTLTSLNPNSFSGLIMHYDAQDTDGDGNISNEPANLTTLNTWINKAGLPNTIITGAPKYNIDTINTFPAINFDGGADAYTINNDTNINTASTYPEKSFAIVIKTSSDITTMQNIYEQGSQTNGYAFQIYGSGIYLGMWNNGIVKSINLGQIEQNKAYYIILNQEKPSIATLKGYLNGKLINTLINIPDQTLHSGNIGLGKVNGDTINLSNNSILSANSFLKGHIGEFISWNHSLTNSEIVDLKKYIEEKWNMGKASILDNVNISIIVKDINLTTPH